ncbi:MAG: protein translocase subunit SecD [Candidatus Paceibacterota bacterium]
MSERKEPSQTEKFSNTLIRIFYAVVVLCIGGIIGFFVYANSTDSDARFPFKFGLDLAGGSHLVYEADVSEIEQAEISELMGVLRDVIERRVNVFGVSEPIVRVEESSFVAEEPQHRLVVELPGVTDVAEAIAEIGRTPLLEFKLVDQEAIAALEVMESLGADAEGGAQISNVSVNGSTSTEPYIDTGLTGRYLESARIEFIGQTGQGGLANEPVVSVTFTSEGAELFEEITANNIGQQLAIFLDGEIVSAPRINERIGGGTAIISGNFTADEAQELAQNLSFGALPMPIELVSTQTIGASLGGEILEKGIIAGVIGFSLISLFMLVWYRLPGLIAVVALIIYVTIMLALFQLIPVTLTAAGLAGFILSLGMAVDANVLVFERMKEEYRAGAGSREAARIGFTRAWGAIRDGNVTSLLSAVILFWFGTSLVKGFALIFGIGVVFSMISALLITRTLLLALPQTQKDDGIKGKLFNFGLGK